MLCYRARDSQRKREYCEGVSDDGTLPEDELSSLFISLAFSVGCNELLQSFELVFHGVRLSCWSRVFVGLWMQ